MNISPCWKGIDRGWEKCFEKDLSSITCLWQT